MPGDKGIEIITLTTGDTRISLCAAMMAASEPWLTLGMDYTYCQKAFEGPCKEVYAAMQHQTLAGFVILQTCGSFKGYIQTLFVNAELRGRGIGQMILQFCEKRILTFSPNIFICVSSFNKRAIKLYEECGFTHVGILPNFIKDGFDELLLRKTVGPIAGYVPPNAAMQP
ncbi:MAG TPA: GNAT family N-acetyltransferase [Chitinophagaceae bacterium]|nr:GNAT family N-acetyltransferase [Chitinophagaceae bacterium]